MLLREVPPEGEICRRRGSMKGVNDEDDLCLDMELLSDWDCGDTAQFCIIKKAPSFILNSSKEKEASTDVS